LPGRAIRRVGLAAVAVTAVLVGYPRVAASLRPAAPAATAPAGRAGAERPGALGFASAAAPGAPPALKPAASTFPAAPLRFGDTWVVISCAGFPDSRGGLIWHDPEAWSFAVTSARPDQVVVEARPVGSVDDPRVTLGLDPRTGNIVRTRIGVPSNYGQRMLDRKYPGDIPCLTEFSPVPIDRPAFPLLLPPAGKNGGAPYREVVHEDTTSPTGDGRVGFKHAVRQRVYRADARSGSQFIERGLRELQKTGLRENIPFGGGCRVELIGAGGHPVEQVWSSRYPWPVYSATETARCWLVEYKKASVRS
jgi:hypothetical protein